jgi:hypothetical protein
VVRADAGPLPQIRDAPDHRRKAGMPGGHDRGDPQHQDRCDAGDDQHQGQRRSGKDEQEQRGISPSSGETPRLRPAEDTGGNCIVPLFLDYVGMIVERDIGSIRVERAKDARAFVRNLTVKKAC